MVDDKALVADDKALEVGDKDIEWLLPLKWVVHHLFSLFIFEVYRIVSFYLSLEVKAIFSSLQGCSFIFPVFQLPFPAGRENLKFPSLLLQTFPIVFSYFDTNWSLFVVIPIILINDFFFSEFSLDCSSFPQWQFVLLSFRGLQVIWRPFVFHFRLYFYVFFVHLFLLKLLQTF